MNRNVWDCMDDVAFVKYCIDNEKALLAEIAGVTRDPDLFLLQDLVRKEHTTALEWRRTAILGWLSFCSLALGVVWGMLS